MPSVSLTVAVLALGVGGVLLFKKKAPKITALLFLIAGLGIAGSGGWISSLLTQGVELGASFVGWATSAGFGVAVPGLLSIVALIWFVHDMWPKHQAGRLTALLGFALPTLLAFYSVGDALNAVS